MRWLEQARDAAVAAQRAAEVGMREAEVGMREAEAARQQQADLVAQLRQGARERARLAEAERKARDSDEAAEKLLRHLTGYLC